MKETKMNNPSTPTNDFDGYNEAHSLIEAWFHNCGVSSGNEPREKANWMITALRQAEAILKRYGLDDHWCTKHRKPKLREIIKSYIISELEFDEALLKEKTLWLYEPFLLVQEADQPVKKKKTEKGLITERGMNYLSLDDGRESEIEAVEISIDPESMLIFDCIAQVARNTINLVFTKEDIDWLINHPVERGELLGSIPAITFTDAQVRKMTGLKDLPGWYIEELCWKVKKVLVKLSKKIFYEDGHWHGFDIYSSIGDVQIDKDGVTSQRANIPKAHQVKHRYTISLNTVLGAIFLSNIGQGKYRLLPQWFYKLRLPSQTLYRAYIVLKKRGQDVDLAHGRVCRLLGEPENPVNITNQVERLTGYFEDLKEKNLISYSAKGKGKNIRFKLNKIGS